MLKLLYKTLLISVMSGSLMTMNTIAFAQDVSASSSATAQMSKSSDTGLTRDANGVLTKTESHSFDGTKNENALNVITMLAVGVIGTKLLMYKKWTLDMSVVAAASAAYIAAEIVNIMNLKSQLNDMNVQITKKSDGKVDQTQIDTLQKLKESYEAVKKSAKTRKMLQLAAAAAFGGAAAIAAYQRMSEDGQLGSCQAAIVTAQDELATCTTEQTSLAVKACTSTMGVGCGASVVFTNEATACTSCAAALVDLNAGLTTTKAKSEIPSPSMAKAPTVGALDANDKTKVTLPCTGTIAATIKSSMVTSSCSTYLIKKDINKGFGASFSDVVLNTNGIPTLEKMLFANVITNKYSEKMSIDPTIGQRNLLQKMMDVLVPRADAGMLAMLGLGTGAAAAFFTAKTAIGRTVDTYMFTPGGRIIAWGILAGAALMGANATQSEIDKIDENIKKIDQILKDMNTLKSGIKSNNVQEQQIKLAAFKAAQEADLRLNPNASVKTDCISSMGSSNCTALSSQVAAMPGFTDLPDSFKSIASQSAALGDGLSGTNSISGSTLTTAASLAGKANAIGKLTDSLKNKINDALSKSGKPKINFNKEQNDLWAQLKSQTGKALRSNNMSPGAFLSSTGLTPISNANAAIANMPSKKSSLGIGGGTAALAPGSSKEKGFDLDFKEAPAAGALAAEGAVQKEEKFDIGSNDINTNSGDSIFKVISDRYIKSGYPKLLEEIPVKN